MRSRAPLSQSNYQLAGGSGSGRPPPPSPRRPLAVTHEMFLRVVLGGAGGNRTRPTDSRRGTGFEVWPRPPWGILTKPHRSQRGWSGPNQ